LTVVDRSGRYFSWLITQRSRVQIPPPQIPRFKQLKLKRLQAVSARTRFEPLSSRETWFAASLLVQCGSRTAGSRSSRICGSGRDVADRCAFIATAWSRYQAIERGVGAPRDERALFSAVTRRCYSAPPSRTTDALDASAKVQRTAGRACLLAQSRARRRRGRWRCSPAVVRCTTTPQPSRDWTRRRVRRSRSGDSIYAYAALLPLEIGLLDKERICQGITQASSFVPLSRLVPDSYAHIASRPSLRRPLRQRVLQIPL
jgi:hypothetical protein